MGMLLLFVHYFAWRSERRDDRVREVTLVLLTATKEGAADDAMEERCIDAGLTRGEITVQRPWVASPIVFTTYGAIVWRESRVSGKGLACQRGLAWRQKQWPNTCNF